MSIAYDTGVDGGLGIGVTSLTFSFTFTGLNGVIAVGARGTLTDGTDNITGVTFNGVAFTFVEHILADNISLRRSIAYWHLIGPPTGTHNIVVTGNAPDIIIAVAQSLTGVAQTGQPDNFSSNFTSGGGGNTVTTTHTTIADKCWTVAFNGNNGGAPAAGAGMTMRVADANGAGIGDSNGDITPPTSYSMTSNQGSANSSAQIMVSYAPFVAAVGSKGLTALGVG